MGLTYRNESPRDLRLDWIRGVAVFVMIVDHLGGASWLHLITGGNMFLVSAAEFFVFISGWVGGIVWRGIAQSRSYGAAVWKIVRRAVILYALTVILTIGFGTFSIHFHLPWANDAARIGWLAFVQNTASLKQTLPFADIILLYTLLFAAAPIGLFLLYSGRTFWLVAAAVLMWLEFQVWGLEIPWQIPEYGFQFAAWQLLFFSAMTIGFHHRTLARKFERVHTGLWWILAAVLFLGMAAFYQRAMQLNVSGEPLATSAPFLKSALAIGRVGAFAIALPLVFLAVHLLWKPLQFFGGWLFLPFGQNALLSYSLHIVLVALYAVWLPAEWFASSEASTIVQAIGVLVIWALVRVRILYARNRRVASSSGYFTNNPRR